MPLKPKQQPPYYQQGYNIKRYIARLSQTGTNAPAPLIYENTIGNLLWTRESQGIYRATLANAFNPSTTALFSSNGDGNKNADFLNPGTDYVQLEMIQSPTGAHIDNWSQVFISILVYSTELLPT